MPDQVDILHPLTTLGWEQCGQVPKKVGGGSIKCVTLGGEIFMASDTHLSVSKTTDLHSWTDLDEMPVTDGILITHCYQLVLVGGIEDAGTDYFDPKASNKLWSLSIFGEWHESQSLPPMRRNSYKCFRSAAVSDLEYLVVIGGYNQSDKRHCLIEVLIGDQWFNSKHQPKKYLHGKPSCTLHNRNLYFDDGCDRIFYCNFRSLIATCKQPDVNKSSFRWKSIRAHGSALPTSILSFGQHLIRIHEYGISVYHPFSDWIPLGTVPKRLVSSAILPTGELIAVCAHKLMKMSLTLSPYDPDSRFSMSHLTRLEAAEIKVVTALRDNIDSLKKCLKLGLTTSKSVPYPPGLEHVMDMWARESREDCPLMTWRSFLHIISQKLNLRELSQHVEYYLQYGSTEPFLNAYCEILATQECLEMWFIKVILLGAPRLGKTTMRRRLTGEIDDISSSGEGEQPSTGTVESGPSIVVRNLSSTTALITESEWLATKDLTEETCAILQYFRSHISEKKAEEQSLLEVSGTASIAKSTVDDVAEGYEITSEITGIPCSSTDSDSDYDMYVTPDTSPATSDSDDYNSLSSWPSTASWPSTSSSLEDYTPPPEYRFSIPEMIRNAVSPQCWREITEVCRDTAFLNMGDTGGQPEFMDMQPALTVGPALYLFFCKLADDLDSLYKVSYLSPSRDESTVPRESAYTAKEVLFTSLASIACFRSSSSTSLGETTSSTADKLLASCNESIAYVIGTHKDLVSEEQINEFDEKLQRNIWPTDFFQENIVQFSSEERMVLPVDNMHGGSSEVDLVRKILERSLKKHFKKLSIPASWLVLSLCLRKKEERTASLDSVLQLASELGILRKEAMVALWFLHHYAGVLMYFPNLPELKNTVICDNQIIYDSATNLIVNTFKFRSVGTAASERFRKTGQFSLKDIREATAGVSGDYIPLEKLVKLLAFLNILVSFVKSSSTSLSSRTLSSEEMYFMPSVLLNATHEEMASWWDDTHKQVSPAPLFITYQCGFVPIGVFPAMIANLTAERSLKLRVKGIRKNRVEFQFGRDFDTITLVSQPTYYAVHISRRKITNCKTPTPEVCATVQELVESTLKSVTSRMNYTFTAKYQLGFECPSHPGREHLCVVDNDDPPPHVMCCQGDMDNLEAVDMQSQHLVWFGKLESSSCDDSGTESSSRQVAAIILSLPSLNLLKWKDDEGQEQVFRLVKDVSAKWYDFGLLLGIGFNELEAWDAQHRGDASKCWNKVMDDWLTRGGSCDYSATWEGLYSLLNDLELGSVAMKLKRAVLGQVSCSN